MDEEDGYNNSEQVRHLLCRIVSLIELVFSTDWIIFRKIGVSPSLELQIILLYPLRRSTTVSLETYPFISLVPSMIRKEIDSVKSLKKATFSEILQYHNALSVNWRSRSAQAKNYRLHNSFSDRNKFFSL